MLKILRQSGLSFLWVSFLVLGMDRYAKYWVMQNLSFAEPLRILPIFNFEFNSNVLERLISIFILAPNKIQ